MVTPGRKEAGLIVASVLIVSFIFLMVKIYFPLNQLMSASQLRLESAAITDQWRQEEQFLRHQLELAGKDSVYLTIDLKDSTIALSLLGVQLKKSKLDNIQISKSIYRIDQTAWMDNGFQIIEEHSSISKHPVVYRKAPKDTLEAKVLAEKETGEKPEEDFYFAFFMSKQLLLLIEQNEEPVKNNHKRKNRKLIENNPDYHYIRIGLNKNDAKTIYRAMPENGKVLIRL